MGCGGEFLDEDRMAQTRNFKVEIGKQGQGGKQKQNSVGGVDGE